MLTTNTLLFLEELLLQENNASLRCFWNGTIYSAPDTPVYIDCSLIVALLYDHEPHVDEAMH
jgi:hypothetical protein